MTQSKVNTKRHYSQLSASERGQIQAYLTDHKSKREIARLLNRAPSTISREIKRGTVRQLDTQYLPFYRYFAESGQAIHMKRRQHCHAKNHLKKYWLFFKMLQQELHQKYRVQSVASFQAYFKRKHPKVPVPSVPTIYRYIDQGKVALTNADLPVKLRRRIKNSQRSRQRKNKKILGTSIEKRPSTIEKRQEFGHWEGDLIKGVRRTNEPAILTLTERLTRAEILVKIPNYHAQTCLQAVQKVVKQHSKWFKSITFDNGAEFSLLSWLKQVKIYFAHPYSPWERGSNERANGLLREYFPKGQSFKDFTEEDIKQAEIALNHKYRKILGYHSAHELLQKMFTE